MVRASKLKGVRRQVRRLRPTRSLVGRVDARVDRTLRQQDELRSLVERQAKQLDKLQATVTRLNEAYRPIAQEAKTRMVQHTRMSVQLGALEERMGRLDEHISTDVIAADDPAITEARSIVEAVRREHEQIRVRMQIIGHYEERLRRVEAAIESIAEGDVRRIM